MQKNYNKIVNMKVVTAKYLDDYKIEIIFDDKKRNVINFLPALKKYATCKKYLDITLFKKFKVDSGNIVWGNNWEMIFKIEDLYEDNFNSLQMEIRTSSREQ